MFKTRLNCGHIHNNGVSRKLLQYLHVVIVSRGGHCLKVVLPSNGDQVTRVMSHRFDGVVAVSQGVHQRRGLVHALDRGSRAWLGWGSS